MPKKVVVDGVEQEVYTPEEVESARGEAVEKYKEANPGDAAAVEQLQNDLKAKEEEIAAAKAELAKSGDKDWNFKQLEKKVEAAERAKADLEKSIDSKVGEIRKEMQNNALDVAIRGLAGSDAELAKKVKFHFEKSLASVAANTPEEFTKKIQQAYMLAAGKQIDLDRISAGQYGSGGGGVAPGAGGYSGGGGENKDVSPELKALGARFFGISEEDWKKYDKRDFSTTQ